MKKPLTLLNLAKKKPTVVKNETPQSNALVNILKMITSMIFTTK